MQLITLHKILISASLGVSLLFAMWAVHQASSAASPAMPLLIAAVAVATGALLGVYLRYLIRRTRQPRR